MGTEYFNSEKRVNARLPLGEGVVVWRNGKSVIGSIIDISDHGVSFVYISDNGSEASPSATLDIYFLGGKVTINRISVSVVSDIPITLSNPYSHLSKRRRSVKFLTLTDEQRRLLGDVTSGMFINALTEQDKMA